MIGAVETQAPIIVTPGDQAGRVAGQFSGVSHRIIRRKLDPWKTIKVGGMSEDDLISAISQTGNTIGDYAASVVYNSTQFFITDETGMVDLVVLSTDDLGFTEKPRTSDFMTSEFCVRWSAGHLDGQAIGLCQPEDGPQLRFQYGQQPPGEILYVAMKPIVDVNGYPSVFRVESSSGGRRMLQTCWSAPNDTWDIDRREVDHKMNGRIVCCTVAERFVFRLCKTG